MKIIIFTEAGPTYGYGHLMRCLALAQGFSERSIEVSFVLRGVGNFSELLIDFSFIQVEWLEFTNIEGLLEKKDIAIIDSYYVNEKLCKLFYQEYKKVLFLDDYKRINYPGGFVLNGTIGAEQLNYPRSKAIKYLIGAQFQPLRREFWKTPEFTVGETIKHIMITFGGSDITNETPIYLKRIRKNYPSVRVTVIIGNGFKQIEDLLKLKDKYTKFMYSPDALSILNIMLDSDLAISAAGQTLSELARVGVPTIGIRVADNQKNNVKYWLESGFLISKEILGKEIKKEKRNECSLIGQSLIDGLGVKRIVETVLC